MAVATIDFGNNFRKPEPIFIEKYIDLPKYIDKRRLYELSDGAFEEFKVKSKTLGTAIFCSEAEVKAIREELQDTEGQLKLEDFYMIGDIKCGKCKRQFNYFDGLDFIRSVILGPKKKINIAPVTQEQTLRCSHCNFVWKSKPNKGVEIKNYAGENVEYIGAAQGDRSGYGCYAGGNAGYEEVLHAKFLN